MANQDFTIASGRSEPAQQWDPRPVAVTLLAVLCIAFFWWAAKDHFFAGSWARTVDTALSIPTSIFTGQWAGAANFIGWTLLLFPVMVVIRTAYWFENEGRQSYAGNPVNDATLRNFLFEMLLLALIGFFFWFLVGNAVRNLAEAKIASGFAFLGRNAGFQINQSPFIPYSEASSYGMVYWVGLQNTLVVSVVGIFLATLLGFIVGISRLSKNWIVSRLMAIYIETIRNVPVVLWILLVNEIGRASCRERVSPRV